MIIKLKIAIVIFFNQFDQIVGIVVANIGQTTIMIFKYYKI